MNFETFLLFLASLLLGCLCTYLNIKAGTNFLKRLTLGVLCVSIAVCAYLISASAIRAIAGL